MENRVGEGSNPYNLLKGREIPSTLDDLDREALDSGDWRMQYNGAKKPETRKVLNVGAGEASIPCATNIDINLKHPDVKYGDAMNLENFNNGQFKYIILNNPQGYKPLESHLLRVLKPGGIMTANGNYNNRSFRQLWEITDEQLEFHGLKIISKENSVNDIFLKYGGKRGDGTKIPVETLKTIILEKVGN